MTLYVAPIVEGDTEVDCAEFLLQKIWRELVGGPERLQVIRPIRGSRSSLLHPDRDDLAKAIRAAWLKVADRLETDPDGRGMLLIWMDADDDCPAELGPRTLSRAKQVRADLDIGCVFAVREFENWFVAAAESLRTHPALPDGIAMPNAPETIHAPAWLTKQMQSLDRTRSYRKVTDARELVKLLNPAICRTHSPSFNRLCGILENWADPLP